MKICTLCESNPATKKNSHIFPRFLGISLLTTPDNKRKGFTIDEKAFAEGSKPQSPTQDSPPNCETKIGAIERNFSNQFYTVLQDKERWNAIHEIVSPKGYKVKHLAEVDYQQIKLTVYSMLFRASISSLDYFLDLKINKSSKERLRQILNSDRDFEDIPFSIITPESDFDSTRNYIYANSNSFSECMLWANELLIFVNLEGSNNELIQHFSDATSENGRITVGVIPEHSWDSLRKLLIDVKMTQMYGSR